MSMLGMILTKFCNFQVPRTRVSSFLIYSVVAMHSGYDINKGLAKDYKLPNNHYHMFFVLFTGI